MKRTAIGIFAAPIIPSIALIHDAGIVLSFIMSYLVAFTLGIPTIFILKKIKRESHLVYSLAGFSLGALYLVLIGAFSMDSDTLMAALLLGCIGLATSITFSLIQGSEERNRA